MKVIYLFSLFLFSFLVSITANAVVGVNIDKTHAETASQSVDFVPAGIIIVKADAPSFNISLPRNASTGYMWILKNPEALMYVKPISYNYETNANKKLVGSGGQDVWTFMGRKEYFVLPIMFQLHFVYVRAWEKNQAPEKTAAFTIVMVPGN